MSDDLISRQAAIDAMESYSKFLWGRYHETFNLGAVASILSDLPSVQPEIVRCKDCKYNPNNPRPYADDDPIETFIHCKFMEADGFCSKGKRREE